MQTAVGNAGIATFTAGFLPLSQIFAYIKRSEKLRDLPNSPVTEQIFLKPENGA